MPPSMPPRLDFMASSTFCDSRVDGGGDEVLQHLDVAGLHDVRLNHDAQDLLLAVHLDGDAAAAGGGLDHDLLHLFLQLLRLLPRLRQHFLQY